MNLWMGSEDWRRACKPYDTLYTVVVVDPLVRVTFPLVLSIGCSPNQITLFRLFLSLLIGVLFLHGFALLGALGFLLWYFLDCIDGKLARLSGRSSLFGNWLDRTTDRVGVALILVTEGLYLQSGGDPHAVAVSLAFVALWLLGITNAELLRQVRLAGGEKPGASPSHGVNTPEAEHLYRRIDDWLGKRRLGFALVGDVEWLHLAVVGAAVLSSRRMIMLSGVLFFVQVVVLTIAFWFRRRHVIANRAR